MDVFELKASIRSRIWDIMHENRWQELDNFSLDLSDKIAKKMIARRAINLNNIVANVKTNFFSANSIPKNKFVSELKVELDDLIELFRPVKRRTLPKPKNYKDVPRNDFSDDVKRQVFRNQDHSCAECGRLLNVTDWDHIDGNRSNNDISNCQALCPICHAIKSRKKQMGIR